MSDVNFQFVHSPSVVSTDDLFICGKCRNQFTDLNIFLVHRSTCSISNSSQILNVCPIGPSSPTATLLCSELDAILRDVESTTTTTNEPEHFYPPNNSNSFDEFFPPTTINENENQTLETGLEQMSLLECPVCDEQFDAPIVLENHVFEHSTVDDSSSSYVDILDDQQTATSLECKQCTVTFTSNASLNIHKKIFHCLNPVFRCLNDACAQLFDKPVDYILHARVHSQKRIRRSTTYRRHRKRTYRCRICKKIFFNSDQLQNHLSNETHKFLCQLCPAEFDSNNSYHNHLAKHSDGAIYRCTICIESFQKRHDLSRHVLTKHNDDLPKQKSCDSCKLTFKTTFHLNRHNNTKHSDVKPFKCEQDGCDKAFARKDKLKQHAATHSEQGGMFKCSLCLKTFVRPEHLRDHHIVRHSRQYPFRCEYCGKGFLHQNQLYQHHKQRHSNENQQMKEEQEQQHQQNHFDSITIDFNENTSDFFF